MPLALEPRRGKLTSVSVLWGSSHHSENRALAFPAGFLQSFIRRWEARLRYSLVYCSQGSHHSHSAVFWFVVGFFCFFFNKKKKKEVQATKGHGGLLALVLTHVKAGDFCLRMAIRDLSKLELRALNCKEVKMGRVAVIKK